MEVIKTVDPRVVSLFRKLMAQDRGGIVGERAVWCWKDAQTRVKFQDLESQGLVKIEAQPEEESYFGAFGEPDTNEEREQIEDALEQYGCWYVCAFWRADEDAEWEQADGVGMCVYNDPCNPDENCYVDQLMRSAIDALDDHNERERFAAGASD